MVKDRLTLGNCNITNIPPALRSTPQIDVTFEIKATGTLVVSALEKGTGGRNSNPEPKTLPLNYEP